MIQSIGLMFRHNMAIIKFLPLQQKEEMRSIVQYHRQKQQRTRTGFFPEELALDKIPEYHLVQRTPSVRQRQVMMEGPLGTPGKWIQHQGLPQSCPSPCPLGPGDRVVQTSNTCLGMSLLKWGERAALAFLIARRYCSCVSGSLTSHSATPCWLVCEGCSPLFSQTLLLYGWRKYLVCEELFQTRELLKR